MGSIQTAPRRRGPGLTIEMLLPGHRWGESSRGCCMATIRLIHFILQFGSLSARPFQMHPPKRSRRPPPLPSPRQASGICLGAGCSGVFCVSFAAVVSWRAVACPVAAGSGLLGQLRSESCIAGSRGNSPRTQACLGHPVRHSMSGKCPFPQPRGLWLRGGMQASSRAQEGEPASHSQV